MGFLSLYTDGMFSLLKTSLMPKDPILSVGLVFGKDTFHRVAVLLRVEQWG
jgi:hypothetical protein